MKWEVGVLGNIVEEYKPQLVELHTDFEDEAPLCLEGINMYKDIPVFYSAEYDEDECTVIAVMINEKSVEQLFKEYCWITLENYYETCKDRIDITKEEDGSFRVEAITTTYDAAAGMQNYKYTTKDIEIITKEIQEAVEKGFVLRNPISF